MRLPPYLDADQSDDALPGSAVRDVAATEAESPVVISAGAAREALQALELCSFERWYPALKAVTIKSVVIPLSHEFVKHVLADGVFAEKHDR